VTIPPGTCLALDAGTVTAKLAVDGAAEPVTVAPVVGGPWQTRVSAVLSAAGAASPVDGICLAVPEAWLDGGVEGTTAQEALRHACEDELGITRITWTGQLAAVAALAAQQYGPGRYHIADIGATGVRMALIEVAVPAVRIVAAAGVAGGGWRDFDAAVRTRVPDGGHLPADWYRLVTDQGRRSRTALIQAASYPRYREAPVTDEAAPHELLAGPLIDCFAATEQRIRTAAARVQQGGPAEVAVLTGGFGWFPLAGSVLADIAGTDPVVLAPDAAARGALLFARGTVRLARPDSLATVTMPMNRIAAGQLEEASLTLPWTEPFASLADEALLINERILTIDIAGRRVTASVPSLMPGPCRVGVRAGWTGRSALVVRPADGAGAPVVMSLDALSADG
jgi:hypothetical protein